MEQRPHKRDPVGQRTRPPHARQARQAGAPQQAVEDRLRLVVGRVGHHHVPGSEPVGRLRQKCVPQPASPGLEPLATGRRPEFEPRGHALQTERGSQLLHERPIGGRVGPQAVIGVGHHEPAAGPGCRQPHEPQEQGHAIGSARYADEGGECPVMRRRQAGGQAARNAASVRPATVELGDIEDMGKAPRTALCHGRPAIARASGIERSCRPR